jgi:DNA-binding GntR family transcriptional regulator
LAEDGVAKRAKGGSAREAKIAFGAGLRLQRAGLHEQAAMRIKLLIIKGALKPGQVLSEVELAEQLGISRTPLREALKLLGAQGLLELRQNRSARVAPMRADDIEQLFEAMAGIEEFAADLAARRMHKREFRRLAALQEQIEKHHGSRNLDSYFFSNQQIHLLIVEAARNGPLQEAHALLFGRAERARYFALSRSDRWDESLAEHRELAQALEAGDGGRAARLIGDHVRRTGHVMKELLGADKDEEEGRGRAAPAAMP